MRASAKPSSHGVQPCETVSAHVIKLPAPDVSGPKAWIQCTLFWSLDDPTAFQECYRTLHESLSRLAVDIPLLLGTLERGTSGDRRDLNVKIGDQASIDFPCEDLTFQLEVPTYETLRSTGFPLTGICDRLFHKAILMPVLVGSPTFLTKLNKLRGGVALTFGILHLVADGWGTSELERLWAQHTTDVSKRTPFRRLKPATQDEDIRQMFHDNTSNQAKMDTSIEPSMQVIPADSPFLHLYSTAAEAAAAGRKAIWRTFSRMSDAGIQLESRFANIWRIPAEKLAQLKADVSNSNSDNDWISTLDAVIGLFWARISYLQQQSLRGYDASTCFFYINFRSRWQPSITMSYTGNAIAPVSTALPLSTLETPNACGLQTAAKAIRKANTKWDISDAQNISNIIMSLPPDKALFLRREIIFGKHNLIYNDYSKFSSNINDWGVPLGRVDCSRFPRPIMPGGCHGIVVLPKLPDGSLEVMLGCSEELRVALDKDPVFAEYAQFVSSSVPQGQSAIKILVMQIMLLVYSSSVKVWRLLLAPSTRRAALGLVLALALWSARRGRWTK